MKLYDLRVNYQTNPLGIDLNHAVFSWKVKEARGKSQAWARLVAAEDRDFRTIVYDSGRAELDSCAHVPQVEWRPGVRYYWTVEVTDDAGYSAISDISFFEGGHPAGNWHGRWIMPPFDREIVPVMYRTFTLEPEELEELDTARLYICGLGLYEVCINGVKVGNQYLTPYFTDYRDWIQYQTYDVEKYLREGENRIDVWLGDGWFKGYFGYLEGGRLKEYYGSEYKLLADLYMTDCGGLTRVVGSDENWKAVRSPILDCGIYAGETYDAALEPEAVPSGMPGEAERPEAVPSGMPGEAEKPEAVLSGMTSAAEGLARDAAAAGKLAQEAEAAAADKLAQEAEAAAADKLAREAEAAAARGTDSLAWPGQNAVLADAPRGKLTPMVGVPVTCHEILEVKEVITTDIGETVLDFGQEITGWVVFEAELPRGTAVHLQYGEILQNGRFYRDNLRSARAEYTFISAGRKQLARPHFTYYGFRYVKVTGMTVDDANKDSFRAWALYSDLAETGRLNTSHEKLNRLIANTRWSQKGNFLDIPTDCPQRDERLGWTGDAQIFSSAASYHMLTPAFYRKYLRDMACEQRRIGGSVPYVVPDVLSVGREKCGQPAPDPASPAWGEAGSCVWGDAAVIIPWTMYQHYGNLVWLGEQYDNMKQWTDFVIRMDEENCGGKRLWTCGFHFGDWLSLDAEGDSCEGGTDRYYVATLSYMHSAELTSMAAERLGKTDDAAYYRKIADEVRSAARQNYLAADGKLTIRTQTAYVLAIWFKLLDEAEMKTAAEELCALLEERNVHLSTGFVGTAYLCQTLSAVGRADLAYTLLLNEDYPSWLYEVNLGATTIWERWNSLLSDGSVSSTGMNSLNHYAYGSVAEWIYGRVCGLQIRQDGCGPREILYAPQPDRRLEFAKAAYDTAAGEYRSDWHWENDKAVCRLTVPFGCRARLSLDSHWRNVTVDGRPSGTAAPEGVLPAGTYIIELTE